MLNTIARRVIPAMIAAALLPAATVNSSDRYFPFVMDGGGWKSIITVTNLDRDPTSCITTPGTADQLSFGYGQVFSISGQRLAASITLRYSQPNHTPAETTMPMTNALERRLVLPFDHTNGGGTRLALVSETVGALVSITIRDEKSNEILTDKLTLSDDRNPAQQIVNLSAKYPQLLDLRGTVECSVVFPRAGRYDELTFTGLALHSNSNGTLSAVQTQTSSDWQQ